MFRQIRTDLPEHVPANKNLFAGTPSVGSLNIFHLRTGFFGQKNDCLLRKSPNQEMSQKVEKVQKGGISAEDQKLKIFISGVSSSILMP